LYQEKEEHFFFTLTGKLDLFGHGLKPSAKYGSKPVIYKQAKKVHIQKSKFK